MSEEKMGNKEWQKPELVVLVRSKPEEAVLAACKEDTSSSGANNQNSRCQSYAGYGSCNEACNTYTGT